MVNVDFMVIINNHLIMDLNIPVSCINYGHIERSEINNAFYKRIPAARLVQFPATFLDQCFMRDVSASALSMTSRQ